MSLGEIKASTHDQADDGDARQPPPSTVIPAPGGTSRDETASVAVTTMRIIWLRAQLQTGTMHTDKAVDVRAPRQGPKGCPSAQSIGALLGRCTAAEEMEGEDHRRSVLEEIYGADAENALAESTCSTAGAETQPVPEICSCRHPGQ